MNDPHTSPALYAFGAPRPSSSGEQAARMTTHGGMTPNSLALREG